MQSELAFSEIAVCGYNYLARLCSIHGGPDMVPLRVQGVIGEGYERLMNPKSVPEEDDYKFHGVEKDYEQASYFSTSHPSCMFGVPADTSSIKRRLAERVHVAFPCTSAASSPSACPRPAPAPSPACAPSWAPACASIPWPSKPLPACPPGQRKAPPCKGVLCQERPGQAPSLRLVLYILRAPATSSWRSPQLRATASTQCLSTFWQFGINACCLYAGFNIAEAEVTTEEVVYPSIGRCGPYKYYNKSC